MLHFISLMVKNVRIFIMESFELYLLHKRYFLMLFFFSFSGDQNVSGGGGSVRDLLGSHAHRQRPHRLRGFG